MGNNQCKITDFNSVRERYAEGETVSKIAHAMHKQYEDIVDVLISEGIRPDREETDEKIISLYREGYPISQISKNLRVTPEKIKKMVSRYGPIRGNGYKPLKDRSNDMIFMLYKAGNGSEEIADELELSVIEVEHILNRARRMQ